MGDVTHIGAAAAPGSHQRARADAADVLRELARRVEAGEVSGIAIAHLGPEHVATWFQTVECLPAHGMTLVGALVEVQQRVLAHTQRHGADD